MVVDHRELFGFGFVIVLAIRFTAIIEKFEFYGSLENLRGSVKHLLLSRVSVLILRSASYV